MVLLIILLITCFSAAAVQNPPFLITAPSEVHVGLDETITVQVFESSSDVWVTVYFEEQTEKVQKAILSQVISRKLSPKNNFTEVIHVQILPEKTLHLNLLNGEQYVTIVTEISSPFLVRETASIRLKSRPYFIYIETDKPVYAPAETVHYQILTLGQELKPVTCSVTVEVLDANGSVLSAVSRQTVAQSVHIGEVNIRPETHEIYQIRATVTNNSEYYGLKRFQVRKYEFPKFDLRITPDYWYFLVNSDTFSLTIQVANKMDAALNATVSFGISLLSGTMVHLRKLDQRLQVRNGSAPVILQKAELLEQLRSIEDGNMDIFIGGTLYIAAEVSDGKYTEKKVVDNIAFRLSHFNINFTSMKPYFTPGARFYIPISVTYPNGSPAINVSLHVNITILEEEVIKDSIEGTTGQLGEMIFSLMVPVNALSLNVTASAGSASGETAKKHGTVKRRVSDSGRYLYINVPQALLYPGDIITVNLTALGLLSGDDVQYYYYMVLGKGRTLDIQRVEKRSETSFELLITTAMVPYFRIVAYYPLNEGGRWSIVVDSVRVEAESLCDTKFQVHAVSHLPDLHQLQLTVLSDTPAQIFVKTMDVRLKPLEEGDSITHRRVFEDLNSTDIGLPSGNGSNPASVFKDSGLISLSNLMTPSPEPEVLKLKQRQEPWRNVELWRKGSGRAKVNITLKDPGPYGDDVEWVRPLFPGTSMWQFETYPGNNTFRLGFDPHPPESWDLQALSLSEEDG